MIPEVGMARIYIEPAKAKTALSQQEALERALQALSKDVGGIRRGLNYKIAGREAIDARLRDAINQINKEAESAKAMRTGLEQIITRYEQAENSNFDRIAAEKTRVQSGDGNGKTQSSGEELLNVPKAEMDKFILQFEKDNPKLARDLNKFLSGGKNNKLDSDDIRNIKYLAYNAEEPYRTIFLKSVSKCSIGDGNLSGGAYYRPWAHTVNYTYSNSFENDPRGGYTTFFHECGHAVDDLSDVSKWLGSDTEKFKTYSADIGKDVSLREAIEYDVYYNEKNPHSMTNIANEIKNKGVPGTGSGGNVNKVIDALKSGDTSKLSNEDLILYQSVKNQHNRTTGRDEEYEAVTDVYGGMSHNELRNNGYGHDEKYWDTKKNAACELWAEYFSYNMGGNTENLQNLLEYFPEAAKVMEQYANTLGA